MGPMLGMDGHRARRLVLAVLRDMLVREADPSLRVPPLLRLLDRWEEGAALRSSVRLGLPPLPPLHLKPALRGLCLRSRLHTCTYLPRTSHLGNQIYASKLLPSAAWCSIVIHMRTYPPSCLLVVYSVLYMAFSTHHDLSWM